MTVISTDTRVLTKEDVTRGKRQSRYLVAVSVCPDNSARMCK